jgi:uncharacterized protein (DUF302 family)
MAETDLPFPRWVKVLDQSRCIGCHACTTACKSENEVPVGVTRTYVKSVDVGTFPQARRAFQVTLAGQEFGVLTEIDVTATMRAKRGEPMEDYVILGACNPPFAHQALDIDRSIGLLLPCNVVVRAGSDGTIVEAPDPQVMVTLTGRAELKPVADEVAQARGRTRRAGPAECDAPSARDRPAIG